MLDPAYNLAPKVFQSTLRESEAKSSFSAQNLLFVVVLISTLALLLKVATTPGTAVTPLGKILCKVGAGLAFFTLILSGLIKYNNQQREKEYRAKLLSSTTFTPQELYNYLAIEEGECSYILPTLDVKNCLLFLTYFNKKLEGRNLLVRGEINVVSHFTATSLRYYDNNSYRWHPQLQPDLTHFIKLLPQVSPDPAKKTFSFEQILQWLISEVTDDKLSETAGNYLRGLLQEDLSTVIRHFGDHYIGEPKVSKEEKAIFQFFNQLKQSPGNPLYKCAQSTSSDSDHTVFFALVKTFGT